MSLHDDVTPAFSREEGVRHSRPRPQHSVLIVTYKGRPSKLQRLDFGAGEYTKKISDGMGL